MKKIVAALMAVVLLISSAGCSLFGGNSSEEKTSYEKSTNNYSISTSDKKATEAGAKVLAAGGNAVDAAIAASYVLSVVEPYASGMGGSGGMTIYDPKTEKFIFINYFAEAAKSGMQTNLIGVPGFAAGMEKAHKLYGSTDMQELLKYAVEYAEKGFAVSASLASRISDAKSSFTGAAAEIFSNLKEGDTLVQTELANTIKTIASEGAESLYSGSLSKLLTDTAGFTAEDLKAYEAIAGDAVTDKFGTCTIAAATPPFSGITLIQMLKMMDISNIPDPKSQREQFLENFIKIKMSATSDRTSNLADSRFSEKGRNYHTHTDEAYLKKLLKKDVSKSNEEIEYEDTTHLSVTDKNGMVVSCTNTLSRFFGSRVYTGGFFLNNSLRNFSKGVNEYKPGKRPRTYISPSIIKDESGEIYAVGTPGGNVIPTVLSLVISDIQMFETDPQEAVDKMRIFVKSADTIDVETGLDSELIADPYDLGYFVVPYTSNIYFGSINIAGYGGDRGYFAAYDKRRDGYCVAVNN